MKSYDVIVVGAGISGLSLAHFCSRSGLRTLVLEKSGRTGGCFHSHCFEGDTAGFWLELGAHTCYNSYGNLLRVMEERGLTGVMRRRQKVPFRMLVDGAIKSIMSELDPVELLLSAPRIFFSKKEGQSVEEYYAPIVGRKNFARVFEPAFNAVVSQRANDFPAESLFKKRPRRKDIMKSYTMEKGLQTITDSISNDRDISVITGVGVRTVERSNGGFTVGLEDGGSHACTFVALATPPSAASKILAASFPALAAILSKIEMCEIETMGIALKKEFAGYPAMAGLIAVKGAFYSAVSRDTLYHDGFRGMSFHFKPGLLDDEAKTGLIAESLGLKREHIGFSVSKLNTLPSIKKGHNSLVQAMDKELGSSPLFLTGNYFQGLAVEDCVSRSFDEFGRLRAFLS